MRLPSPDQGIPKGSVDADATTYSAMARSPSAATARLINLPVTTNQLDLRGGKSLPLHL